MPAMRFSHVLGLILWRGGVLLISAWLLYVAARAALQWVEIPPVLAVGVGLILSGLALLLLSVICERVVDARAEGDLRS